MSSYLEQRCRFFVALIKCYNQGSTKGGDVKGQYICTRSFFCRAAQLFFSVPAVVVELVYLFGRMVRAPSWQWFSPSEGGHVRRPRRGAGKEGGLVVISTQQEIYTSKVHDLTLSHEKYMLVINVGTRAHVRAPHGWMPLDAWGLGCCAGWQLARRSDVLYICALIGHR